LGKEAAGDVLPIVDGTDELDVDAETAVRGKGEEGEAARVRDVEVDGRVASGGGDRGFAPFGVMELDFVGRCGEVLAEELAEDGTRGDVGVAVAMESEAVGSGVLVGGEGGLPGNRRQALGIVGQAPDVDLAWSQGREGARRPQPIGGCRHGGHSMPGGWRGKSISRKVLPARDFGTVCRAKSSYIN